MKFFVKMFNGWKTLTIFGKSFILDVWHSSEYGSEWDLKQEKKRNNYFPGWKLCLAYAYFFHWFQARYAYKRYAYKKTCNQYKTSTYNMLRNEKWAYKCYLEWKPLKHSGWSSTLHFSQNYMLVLEQLAQRLCFPLIIQWFSLP